MKVMKKSFVGIIIAVCCVVSVAMAECPEGTYPCTINGQDACCPKSASNGVRGSLDGQSLDGAPFMLADSSSAFWDCTADCRNEWIKCDKKCLDAYRTTSESKLKTCREPCIVSRSKCTNKCKARFNMKY